MGCFQASESLFEIPQGFSINMTQSKRSGHLRALARRAFDVQVSIGLLGSLRQERQTKTNPLSRLCCEERIKGSAHGFFIHAFTIVYDFEDEPVFSLALGHANDDIAGSGSQSVFHNIQDVQGQVFHR